MPTQSAAAEKISLYQPDQEDLIFPETPVFDQVADDREYRKKHLVAACRAFDYHGFDYGFAGHLTIRDPEFLSSIGRIRCVFISLRFGCPI